MDPMDEAHQGKGGALALKQTGGVQEGLVFWVTFYIYVYAPALDQPQQSLNFTRQFERYLNYELNWYHFKNISNPPLTTNLQHLSLLCGVIPYPLITNR